MAIKKFKVQLVESKQIASNVKKLVLKRDDDGQFSFLPGQFITLLFDNIDSKLIRRSYSISSTPEFTNLVEIAISYVHGGIASKYLFKMQPGDKLNAMGPAGRLVLKDSEKIRKLVLVGTGTGIAPYRAMLPTLQQALISNVDKIYIFLGVQYRADAVYAEDFREYSHKLTNLHFTACLSREQQELFVDEQKCYVQHCFDQLNLEPKQDIVYLCGNPNMIDDSFSLLTESGFDSKRVRREKYISSN